MRIPERSPGPARLHLATWPAVRTSCCWRRRADTAPGSTGPCRRSSARSMCTARPCTCARRSFTTSTWSRSSASAARSSSTPSRGARGLDGGVLGPRGRPERPRRRARRAACRRSTPPARSSPRSTSRREVRRGGLHDRPDRARRPRGGRGDDGRGPRSDRARAEHRRRRCARGRGSRDGSPTSPRRRSRWTRPRSIINRLRERFPAIIGPRTDDICYATTNRQAAVKQLARRCDLVLVIGSRNSSNSNRLVEVAREYGADSHLIDNERRGPGGLARGQADRRDHLGRERPRGAGAAAGRASSARGNGGGRGAPGGAGGRAVHAPEGDPPGGASAHGRASAKGSRALRTLVVSDLHLGARREPDVLRRAGAARRADRGGRWTSDRLVLLGDVIELRHGPLRATRCAAAQPVLEAIGGGARPADTEVVIVPGQPRPPAAASVAGPPRVRRHRPALGLEAAVDWLEGEPLARSPAWLGPARTRVAYPGVWLREDMYAMHGHYSDRNTTVPILERLGAGVMAPRGRRPQRPPRARRGLRGDARADVRAGSTRWPSRAGSGRAGREHPGPRVARACRGRSRRRVRVGGRGAAFTTLVFALNRAGIGPLRPDVSGPELRRAGLRAFSQVLLDLGISGGHVMFGHTHRAGPLPGDDRAEWLTRAGGAARTPAAGCTTPVSSGDEPRTQSLPPRVRGAGRATTAPRSSVNLLDPGREADRREQRTRGCRPAQLQLAGRSSGGGEISS